MLPFWLAVSASLALHLGVLLAPGWGLPLDDGHEASSLDATIAVIPSPAARPAIPPPVKKRPQPRSAPPSAPAAPVATVPVENVPASEAAGPVAEEVVPETAPVASPAPTADAVPPAPTSPQGAGRHEVAVPSKARDWAEPNTFAHRWPRSGRIVYQVSWGEQGLIVGQCEQRWEHDGQRYSLHAEIGTTGLAALFRPAKVVQDSRGIFDAAGLRPLEFAVMREGKSKESVRFDPEEGRIILARGDSVPFVPAAQDMLSLFYQLAALPFDVPGYPLAVVTGRKLTTFAISVGGESALETPQGLRRVRHLKVSAGKQEDSTEIWLDVETRLPLKIRHRDRKGEVFDQVAIAIETEPSQ